MRNKPIYERWWFWLIFVFATGFVGSRIFDSNDDGYLTFFLLVIGASVLIALAAKMNRKRKEKMEKYGAAESYIAFHMHGIPHASQNALANIFINDEKMFVECKDITFELKLERVTAAEGVLRTDLLKQDKSVIARGVVGGLLLGPIGAIVGGMSGVGTKDKKGAFLVINYRSSATDQIEVIIFDMKNVLTARKIAKSLTRKIVETKSNNGVIEL